MDTAAAETSPSPSLALVRRSPYDQVADLVAHLDNLDRLAVQLCKSTLLPPLMQHPANLKLVLMQGLEMGFSVVQSIRASFVITSKDQPPKVGYYVDALVALVRASGVCRFFRVEVCSAERCRVVCARKDEDESVIHVFEMTMVQAMAANLDKRWEFVDGKMTPKQKYTWVTAPSDMLRNRTSGRAVKSVFQDVVFGMATPDELDDVRDANTIEMMETNGVFVPLSEVAAASRASSEPTTVIDAPDAPADVPVPTPQSQTGDAGWDAALAAIGKLEDMGGIVMNGWFPEDLLEEWVRRLQSCVTRAEANSLAQWIGAMSAGASKSKTCGEVVAKMKMTFNERTAEIRKAGGK